MTYKDEIKEKLMAYFKSWDGTKNTNELCEEICEILSEKSYEDGLNDAWECARKLILIKREGGLSMEEIEKIFGDTTCRANIIRAYTASETIAKIKEYENKIRPNCSYLKDICPYNIKCVDCEVFCSIKRGRDKIKELKGEE